MSALRVGLDYRPAILSHTGIARSVRELARALAPLELIETHLFAHSFARARVSGVLPSRAHLHRLPLPGKALPLFRKLHLGADRLGGRVTVFHWTDYIHPPLSKARAVLTIHDLAFAEDESYHGTEQSRILLDRTRHAAERAVLVITPTEATATAVRTHLGVDRGRIRVIPFGADHVKPTATDHPYGNRPYLLSLGTIEPRKNHARLLRAFEALPEPRPLLVVIGQPGWESDATVAALRAAEAKESVIWIRNASDATVGQHLQHALALCYPSLLEGFGFPPLEAARLGTPILAGDTPALREVLADAAVYADPYSVENLSTALRWLIDDSGARESMSRKGRQRADLFRWDDCARAHASAYTEAAS